MLLFYSIHFKTTNGDTQNMQQGKILEKYFMNFSNKNLEKLMNVWLISREKKIIMDISI